MKVTFYVCSHCGNIISYAEQTGVPVVCCGQKMQQLVPNTTEASSEKHLPVIHVVGQQVIVNVGSAAHPMTADHYIKWICLQTRQGMQMKNIQPGGTPGVIFTINEEDEVEAAYAWCNLHGLWATEMPKTEPVQEEGGNYVICKCKNVTYFDLLNAIESHSNLSDIESLFSVMQNDVKFSTGCGACREKVMQVISEIMMG